MTFAKMLRLAAALLLASAGLLPAQAASVLPLYLDEIVDHSAVAFEGTCTGNRTERDPATGLVVTYTTFTVDETLKGQVGRTHEIKQVGGTLPGENVEYRIHGVPTFTPGEKYVIFLAGVSSAGFSSPIGLGQGRFRIHGDAKARRVSNGRDFRDMASRIPAHMPPQARARLESATQAVRDMDLVDFKQTVRSRVGAGR